MGEAAAGAAVARGPQIDLRALPAEQGLQQAADTDACAAPFDALPWRGGTQPRGVGCPPARRAGGARRRRR